MENQPTEVTSELKEAPKKVTWEDVKNSGSPEATDNTSTAAKDTVVTPEVKPEVKTEAKNEAPVETKVDYAKELEEYKTRLAKANENTKFAREEIKRLKSKDGDEDLNDPISEETSSSDVERLIEEKIASKLSQFQIQQKAEVLDNELQKLTNDPHEKELIKTVLENEVKLQGNSKEDIARAVKKAYLLANADRIESLAEIKAKEKIQKDTAEQKAMRSASSTGGEGREAPEGTFNYSSEEQKWLSRVGKMKADGD